MVMPHRSTVLDEGLERPATPRVVDFTHVVEHFYARDDKGLMRVTDKAGYPLDRPRTHTVESMTLPYRESTLKNAPGTNIPVSAGTEQQRARMRRRLKRGMRISDEAWNQLYKPIEEWDMEELARGRPRNGKGNFQGAAPKFITREVHERAMEMFRANIRNDMNTQTIEALKTIQMVLTSEETDIRGKPVVPASTKLDAAKFLLEHIVGKPVQPTTSDISVKLQGILGTVMVNPADIDAQDQSYTPAHMGSRELEGDVYDDD